MCIWNNHTGSMRMTHFASVLILSVAEFERVCEIAKSLVLCADEFNCGIILQTIIEQLKSVLQHADDGQILKVSFINYQLLFVYFMNIRVSQLTKRIQEDIARL